MERHRFDTGEFPQDDGRRIAVLQTGDGLAARAYPERALAVAEERSYKIVPFPVVARMAADLVASDAPETRAVGTDPDASVRRFGERRDLPRIETVLRAEMPFGSVA